MSIYVFITKQCFKDADRQNHTTELEIFAKKVEASQKNYSYFFDSFPPPNLKKRFERQIRLIAGKYDVEQHTVIAFKRILVRGGSEYKAFGDSKYKMLPGEDRMKNELTPEALLDFINNRKEPPPKPALAPSDYELGYLYSALNDAPNIYHDHHCCETHMWVEAIQNEEFLNRLPYFISPILDTVNSVEQALAIAICPQDKDYGIIYRKIPEQKMVILFTPFRGEPPLKVVQEKYEALFRPGDLPKDAALQKAKRAYPHELLLNEDAWFRVQRNKEGSMALSLEEVGVLESVRAGEREKIPNQGFPLFINGRAGSGKSTILQYLFSELLYHYVLEHQDEYPPVYFACNDDLLRQAKSNVKDLIIARNSKRDNQAVNFERWLIEDNGLRRFNESFKSFYSWLLGMVPAEKFPLSGKIDYGQFKRWWESRFAKSPASRKLYDPDISWHVIRTYIKGTSAENFLDPDDYSEIPTKQKSITPETYQIVYEKVWSKYQSDQKRDGLWDQQDLARYVLEHELIRPVHPAVFCDEAQDFTGIELEILDRHCLFNARSVSSFEAERIPLAFAGDPFQTLNPTGFRWESTKAFFSEKFIKTYPGHNTRDINYRELTYNYRSSKNIVQFCNSLQLVRSIIFGIPEILPQKPWFDEQDSPSVVYFETGDMDILKILKKQSEIRIIVPCEEGMEGEWAVQNGLAEFVEFDDQKVPKNVVSPARVKGLEFTRVVLFGFGGACPPVLKKIIRSEGDVLNGDEAIEPQYFFNRLYVAASRPTKRLFIIDSHDDLTGFWNRVFENQDGMMAKSTQTNAWRDCLGQIVKGSTESWKADREDPAETADKLAREGKLRNDRVLLRQAAQSYDSANKQSLAIACRAEALEIEGSHLDAAKQWTILKKIDRAVNAAWNSSENGYSFIVKIAEEHQQAKPFLHYKFSLFLTAEQSFEDGIALMRDLLQELDDEDRRVVILTSPSWCRAVQTCIERLIKIKATESSGLWKVAYTNLKALTKSGLKLSSEILGKVAYNGELFEDAYEHWKAISTEHRSKFENDFLRAKIASLPYPQSLDAAGELFGKHPSQTSAAEIVAMFEREGQHNFKENHFAIVAKAFLAIKKPREGLHCLLEVLDTNLVLAYVDAFCASGENSENINLCLRRFIDLMVRQSDWDGILHRITEPDFDKLKLVSYSDWASANPIANLIPFIEVVANDPRFKDARNDFKTKVTEILKREFGQDVSWRQLIHPLVIGKAFEEAGLFRETLPYYEMVAASNLLSDKIRNLAWERWVITKVLQAQRELQSGTRKRAETQLHEARSRAKSLGYRSVEDISEDLPVPLPPTDPAETNAITATPSDEGRSYTLDETIGLFRVRVNDKGTRLNIEHSTSLEILVIKVESRDISLEGEKMQANDASHFIPDGWGLVVDVSRINKGKICLIKANGIEVTIPVAEHSL